MSQRFTVEAAEGADVEAPPDWDDPEEAPLHVLWGRVTALLVGLLLAFGLGRATAPERIERSTLEELRAEVTGLRDDNQRLEQELVVAEQEAEEAAEEAAAAAQEAPAEPGEDTTEEETADPGEEQTYVVKSGDTLGSIAQRFYEDAAFADVIAEANGLTDPSLLRTGMELVIPERPEL